MNEEEYEIAYYVHMVDVMNRTKDIIEQFESCEEGPTKRSLLELIAIYYSKPFSFSDRAYLKENGKKPKGHKTKKEEINFTDKEASLHDVVIVWRNGYIAHSDQSKVCPEIKLRRNDKGKITGMEGSRKSKDIPLLDFKIPTLKLNIQKIIDHLYGKIYT